MKMCGTHNVELVRTNTRYGDRWKCPEAGCTVVCWGGSTSTPADAETRTLRNQCHRMFDPLWQDQGWFSGRSRTARRKRAYRWLGHKLRIFDPAKRHFGMFSAAQCREAISLIDKFASRGPRAPMSRASMSLAMVDDDMPDGAAMALAAEMGGYEDEGELIDDLIGDMDDDDSDDPDTCPHCALPVETHEPRDADDTGCDGARRAHAEDPDRAYEAARDAADLGRTIDVRA